MATTTLMTAEEFARLNTAENEDYELVDGELIPLSSATLLHNRIRGRIERFVENYFEKNRLGGAASETECRINSNTVRRPDLSIFIGDDWTRLDLNLAIMPFAPTVAVEVLSPSEHSMDVSRKVRDYLGAGSNEVWILDHANGEVLVRTKTGIRLLQGSDVLDSPLLPGFAVSVAELLTSL
jgi:Uma2 family endonuclease